MLVDSELKVVASEQLQKEVELELKKEEPKDEEKAQAILNNGKK